MYVTFVIFFFTPPLAIYLHFLLALTCNTNCVLPQQKPIYLLPLPPTNCIAFPLGPCFFYRV